MNVSYEYQATYITKPVVVWENMKVFRGYTYGGGWFYLAWRARANSFRVDMYCLKKAMYCFKQFCIPP